MERRKPAGGLDQRMMTAAAIVICALLRTPAAVAVTEGGSAARTGKPSSTLQTGGDAAQRAWGRLPLHFEPAPAGFVAVGGAATYRIEPTRLHFARENTQPPLALRFENANRRAALAGEDPLEGRSHYFVDGMSRLDVPHFARARVRDLYRGIDLVYQASGRDLEYDLVVAPHGDPGAVRFSFPGADRVSLERSGDLVVESGAARIRHLRPRIYQRIDGEDRFVTGRYVPRGHGRYGVRVGPYDRRHPLVIDPVLGYSTALGGKSVDAALAIAVDGSGNAFVTGWTTSTNFPLLNAYDSRLANGDRDVFVTKLNATGTAILYSTYLGGSKGLDSPSGIAIDAQGNAYVTGTTSSNDFPTTPGAYRAAPASGGGAFVAKLGPVGNTLVYSTYLPFATNTRVAVDAAGNAYVGGQAATGFATTAGAFQTTIRSAFGSAPFVLKLNAAGTSASYSTFIGGSGDDTFRALALDSAGNAYVAGKTASTDFPVLGALQASPQGMQDGFVAKLDASGSWLVYSTYLGGSLDEVVNAIAVDAAGNAYVAGETYSPNFPVRNAFQPAKSGSHLVNSSLGNAFVAKINAAGDALVYASFLGGEICYPQFCQTIVPLTEYGGDAAYGIGVDAAGHAVITGVANTYAFPLVDSRLGQKQQDNQQSLFVAKIAAGGSALLYSTLVYTGYDYYGPQLNGAPGLSGDAIAVDGAGDAYLALQADGDFPTTPGAFQSTTVGGHSFVFKLSAGTVSMSLRTSPSPSTLGDPLTLTASVAGAASGGAVTFFDGSSNLGSAPVVNGTATLSARPPAGIRRLFAVYRDGSSESDSGIVYHAVNQRSDCP
jgi:hypothetical protein